LLLPDGTRSSLRLIAPENINGNTMKRKPDPDIPLGLVTQNASSDASRLVAQPGHWYEIMESGGVLSIVC
jgi:hypothetical protein